MIYLILPRGNNFGWGICGKYLVKELSGLTDVQYITDPFNVNDIGDDMDYYFLKSRLIPDSYLKRITNGSIERVEHPVLQAIANHTLRPWGINLKGSFKAGYTFFEENVLSPEFISIGRENYDVVVAGSSWCEEILRNHGLDRVTTVIQGIDPRLFNPQHNGKNYFKDKFVVFSGGKFELRKGQDLVIKAYKVLQDRHKDVMLVNSWFNPWMDSMKTMAASSHIYFDIQSNDYVIAINSILERNGIDLDRVITMLPRANSSMSHIYKNTDIGLFPNRCEGGTNLVLMEYMACGKPTIASYSSGHKDILSNDNAVLIKKMKEFFINRNGKPVALWDNPDLDETINHLEWAYNHRDDLKSIGAHAAKDLAQLTWQRSAKQFYYILEPTLHTDFKQDPFDNLSIIHA